MRQMVSALLGRALHALAACGVACAIMATAAAGQEYPSRSVKFIVPYSAGSAADLVSRLVAGRLEEALRVPVVVENKPGASGHLAWDFVARSPADGYTIGMMTTAAASSVALMKNPPRHPVRDFTPIGLSAVLHSVAVVNPALPIKSIEELVSHAKANPNTLTFASAGVGTGSHLSVELFRVLTSIDIRHVPYRGTVNALPDLLQNRTSLMFDFVPLALQHIKAGQLRALAVTMKSRSPLLPDVPTIQEAGVREYEFTNWFGVVGPAGMPAAVVAKLSQAIVQGMNNEDVKAELVRRGGEVVTSTPQEFSTYLEQQVELWTRVVTERGLAGTE